MFKQGDVLVKPYSLDISYALWAHIDTSASDYRSKSSIASYV